MAQQSVAVTPAHLFFDDNRPYYINRVSESFELQLHRHEFTEICLVMEGAGVHYIGEQSMDVHAGDVFVLPLGTPHVFRPRSTSSRYPLMIGNFILVPGQAEAALSSFPGLEELQSARKALNLLPGSPEWFRLRDDRGVIRRIMEEGLEVLRDKRPGGTAQLHALFILLLAELEEHCRGGAKSHSLGSRSRPGIEAVIRKLRSDPGIPFRAEELAGEAGLSVRHFHRLFAETAGKPFSRFVQELRIREACRLLRSTAMGVEQIAEACGYQDRSFFTVLFRRHTGLSPREYRERRQPRSTQQADLERCAEK
ncbi:MULTISPECIES: AraC family transcriptional regulator [unclassified Paenibacillus]|uniref:AraC family transcriptional regulator n=1 Tax=unclassified Paenibacillus TaxID=185978 RepID=UPI000955DDBA|nr:MULTISPECIES: AraC family transcriptional regulator [unclassified Paenibacillus]ASS65397.1 AraC family transcriptional regulator [Paenibacillus sp. RUD330]SIQ37590.1 AraC-type DNA-binding protein [Paenibacillus sp. RU4X]SIQ59710.1 AraC-type DNA-binding protein [Paenibacillus sp. RU4T]